MAKTATVSAGNLILLKIQGQEVGRAQSISGSRSFGQQAVYEIGNIMPQEHVPTQYQGSVTLSRYLIREKDLVDLGISALGEEILARDLLTIEVVDKETKKTIRAYEGCSLNSGSENFSAGGLAGEQAEFVYLRTRKTGMS